MLLQKGKVKAMIVQHGLQSNGEALEIIDRKVAEYLDEAFGKAKEQGKKRLMSDAGVYFFRSKPAPTKSNSNCKRCCNIKETYIKWARQIQTFCHDEATILLNRLLKNK